MADDEVLGGAGPAEGAGGGVEAGAPAVLGVELVAESTQQAKQEIIDSVQQMKVKLAEIGASIAQERVKQEQTSNQAVIDGSNLRIAKYREEAAQIKVAMASANAEIKRLTSLQPKKVLSVNVEAVGGQSLTIIRDQLGALLGPLNGVTGRISSLIALFRVLGQVGSQATQQSQVASAAHGVRAVVRPGAGTAVAAGTAAAARLAAPAATTEESVALEQKMALAMRAQAEADALAAASAFKTSDASMAAAAALKVRWKATIAQSGADSEEAKTAEAAYRWSQKQAFANYDLAKSADARAISSAKSAKSMEGQAATSTLKSMSLRDAQVAANTTARNALALNLDAAAAEKDSLAAARNAAAKRAQALETSRLTGAESAESIAATKEAATAEAESIQANKTAVALRNKAKASIEAAAGAKTNLVKLSPPGTAVNAPSVGMGATTGEEEAESKLPAVTSSLALVGSVALASAAAVAVVSGTMFELAKSAGQTESEMKMMAERIGVSTKELQEFNLIAKLSGISAEQLQRSIAQFALRTTGKASATTMEEGETVGAEQLKGAQKLLKAIGVETEKTSKSAAGTITTSFRSVKDILLDLSDVFSKLDDGTVKTSLAMQLFGRQGLYLVPMLSRGREGIKELADAADKFSADVNEKHVKAFEEYTTAESQLGQAWLSFKGAVADTGVLAIATGVIRNIAQAVQAVTDAMQGYERETRHIAAAQKDGIQQIAELHLKSQQLGADLAKTPQGTEAYAKLSREMQNLAKDADAIIAKNPAMVAGYGALTEAGQKRLKELSDEAAAEAQSAARKMGGPKGAPLPEGFEEKERHRLQGLIPEKMAAEQAAIGPAGAPGSLYGPLSAEIANRTSAMQYGLDTQKSILESQDKIAKEGGDKTQELKGFADRIVELDRRMAELTASEEDVAGRAAIWSAELDQLTPKVQELTNKAEALGAATAKGKIIAPQLSGARAELFTAGQAHEEAQAGFTAQITAPGAAPAAVAAAMEASRKETAAYELEVGNLTEKIAQLQDELLSLIPVKTGNEKLDAENLRVTRDLAQAKEQAFSVSEKLKTATDRETAQTEQLKNKAKELLDAYKEQRDRADALITTTDALARKQLESTKALTNAITQQGNALEALRKLGYQPGDADRDIKDIEAVKQHQAAQEQYTKALKARNDAATQLAATEAEQAKAAEHLDELTHKAKDLSAAYAELLQKSKDTATGQENLGKKFVLAMDAVRQAQEGLLEAQQRLNELGMKPGQAANASAQNAAQQVDAAEKYNSALEKTISAQERLNSVNAEIKKSVISVANAWEAATAALGLFGASLPKEVGRALAFVKILMELGKQLKAYEAIQAGRKEVAARSAAPTPKAATPEQLAAQSITTQQALIAENIKLRDALDRLAKQIGGETPGIPAPAISRTGPQPTPPLISAIGRIVPPGIRPATPPGMPSWLAQIPTPVPPPPTIGTEQTGVAIQASPLASAIPLLGLFAQIANQFKAAKQISPLAKTLTEKSKASPDILAQTDNTAALNRNTQALIRQTNATQEQGAGAAPATAAAPEGAAGLAIPQAVAEGAPAAPAIAPGEPQQMPAWLAQIGQPNVAPPGAGLSGTTLSKLTGALGGPAGLLQILLGGAGAIGGTLGGAKGAIGATALVGGGALAAAGFGGAAASGTAAGTAATLGLGAAAGPVGLIIAAVGALLLSFGIFGQKAKAQTDKMVQQIKNSVNGIVEAVTAGDQTVSQGIAGLMQQRQDAINQLSGAKGGKQELQDLLPQIGQQMAQLQGQAKQVKDAFNEAFSVSTMPAALQSYTQQIEDLNKQVNDYVNAGGSAAEATQFLNAQLESMKSDIGTQLLTSEQQTIQQLQQEIQLQKQKQDIISQEAQQEQSLLNQGVASRSRSKSQETAQSIQADRVARDTQLQQVNQQMQELQVQIGAKAQIFGLTANQAN